MRSSGRCGLARWARGGGLLVRHLEGWGKGYVLVKGILSVLQKGVCLGRGVSIHFGGIQACLLQSSCLLVSKRFINYRKGHVRNRKR